VWLAAELELSFPHLSCTVSRGFPARPGWADERGSADADAVLDALVDWNSALTRDGADAWVLGIAGMDLVAPGRAVVLGVATVGGCCGVVSLAALCPDRVPAGEGLALLRTRLLGESLHEIGHIAGLSHCDLTACVMRPVRDAAEVDGRASTFCPACSRSLPEFLRPDP
jgi:archaemetzincin